MQKLESYLYTVFIRKLFTATNMNIAQVLNNKWMDEGNMTFEQTTMF